MRHLGILAHSTEGAALCFLAFCQEGFRELGVHQHPDVTMEGPIYPRVLAARGIGAETPGRDDRLMLNTIIFDELVNGQFTPASRGEYVRVIEDLAARGCDAVALVCTEIPLLVTPSDSPLPILDSTRLLARAAFEVAVAREPLPAWRGGPAEMEAEAS